jgi:hypothetical protein
MAPAERGQPALSQPLGCLGCRVALQEGQGDRAVEAGEDGLGAGPVGLQQGAELVGGRGLGRQMIVAQPCQGLQVTSGSVQGSQPVQPMAVGA